MFDQRLQSTVYDAGPPLKQHCSNVSCLLGGIALNLPPRHGLICECQTYYIKSFWELNPFFLWGQTAETDIPTFLGSLQFSLHFTLPPALPCSPFTPHYPTIPFYPIFPHYPALLCSPIFLHYPNYSALPCAPSFPHYTTLFVLPSFHITLLAPVLASLQLAVVALKQPVKECYTLCYP